MANADDALRNRNTRQTFIISEGLLTDADDALRSSVVTASPGRKLNQRNFILVEYNPIYR